MTREYLVIRRPVLPAFSSAKQAQKEAERLAKQDGGRYCIALALRTVGLETLYHHPDPPITDEELP